MLLSDKSPGPELELAQLSRLLWPQIITSIRDDCGDHTADLIEWEPKGGIVVATTPHGATVLDAFTQQQADAGVVTARLTSDEAHAAEPYLTRDLTAAYHYPDDAQVQPVAAAHAFLRQAKLFGANMFPGVGVVGPLIRAGELVGVETTAGKRYADAVINQRGPMVERGVGKFGGPDRDPAAPGRHPGDHTTTADGVPQGVRRRLRHHRGE